jgi:CubicO group peptidase (beta-lactamase class C family)
MTFNNQQASYSPESQGISSAAIFKFVEAAEHDLKELHSLILVRHGAIVAKGWWSPYGAQLPHMLFSLSKSFTSTGVGLAVAEGRLSVEDRVISFFPDDCPGEVSENLASMRVKDLLSMSTGHDQDSTGRIREKDSINWVKAFLSLPVEHAPGTHFVYNSGATYMLSAIVQKVSGMRLLDYLRPRLMEPLGIEGATWELSPQGIHMGGWGLSIKTEDIARFGQLYLQKGVWNGKQILPEAWVRDASSKQVSNGSKPASDWEQGYGYQFWLCRHGAYRGDGAFGQYCVVMPEQDAVLAITSGLGDMQQPLNLVWDILLPGMAPGSLPENAEAQAVLQQKLSGLTLPSPAGLNSSALASLVGSRWYAIEPGPLQVEGMRFDLDGSGGAMIVRTPAGEQRVAFGWGVWQKGITTLFMAQPLVSQTQVVMASAVWSAEDTLLVTMRLVETPFYHTLTCHFAGDRLEVVPATNVSFGPTEYPPLTGRLVQTE